jgi:phosphoglycerate dehydrogenase-like enzyme
MEFEDAWNQTRFAVETAGLAEYIDVVRCERASVGKEIRDADIAVPLMTALDAATVSLGKRLKLVLQFGVGLEGVDEDACTRRGVVLARIPSRNTGNAHSTAEMAVYLTLAALRKVNQMQDSVRAGTLGSPMGATLFGKTVALVGWGSVGKKIAELLRPFGCVARAVRKNPWPFPCTGEGEDEIERWLVGKSIQKRRGDARIEDDLSTADAVILACAQTAENRGFVDDAFVRAMKRGSVLINVARGGLLNPEAILRALEHGETVGYLASDVAWEEPLDPEHALAKHPRTYFTPHVGGVTDASYGYMGNVVMEAARLLRERKGIVLGEDLDEISCSAVNVA